MLRNNLIVAWRNLRRYRMYAAINVGGLAAAFVVCILVGLYVHSELTWDRFHARGEQIYKVYVTWPDFPDPGRLDDIFAWTPRSLGGELVATVPGVRRSVRTDDAFGVLRYGDLVTEELGLHADPGFFQLFSFPLLAGDPGTVFDAPNSIVLSRQLAQRLFGPDDPMGRTLLLRCHGASDDFVVTGVAADVPYQSSLQFDWVIPFVHGREAGPWDFAGETYLEIAETEGVGSALAFDLDRYMEKGHGLALVPLFDLRLHPQLSSGAEAVLYSYGFVAVLVLLLACINYANLATGMSLTRAREVGVRKVVGAGRGQLVRQYFAESLLLSFTALLLAVALTEMLLPGFNRLMTLPGELDLRLHLRYTPWTVAALAGFGVVMGLVAGAHPALLLSRMQLVEILRDRLQVRSRTGRILVVVQFAASTVFLTTALVVGLQVEHWQAMDQGYDPRFVVCIPTLSTSSVTSAEDDTRRLVEAFRREVLLHPGVLAVSGATGFLKYRSSFRFHDRERLEATKIEVDPYFRRTLGLKLIEGEDLPPDLLSSGPAALVNQSLAAQLEGPVVGSHLEGENRPRIVGVVSDFRHESPIAAKPPIVLSVQPDRPAETVLVRLRPEGVPETLNALRETWDRLSPEVPFTYRFLDDHIAERHLGSVIVSSLLRWLAGFLALIACLGLFGMTSLAVSRRTKEVGVRKVLGASTARVVVLLASQSTRLVLLAVIIATPLAYQLSELFLHYEVDRIELDLVIHAAGGLIAMALAWLVTGYHAIRTALVNPVDLLRDE